MIEIEKRAVACKHWRWLPGMRVTHRWMSGIRIMATESGEQSESYVVLPDADGNAVMTLHDCGIMGGFPDAGSAYPFLPDLSDPATLGCLRHLAAKAHGAWDIVIQVDIQPRMEGTHAWWRAIDSRGRKIQGAFGTFVCPNDGTDIKAHALVEALEAAP
jgi:hypothetical protein